MLHFARWAGLAGMLLAAGVLLFRRLVWRPVASRDGLVLLAKLGALVPILALGAVNNRLMTRWMVRAAASGTPGTTAMVMLRNLVAWEVTLLGVSA